MGTPNGHEDVERLLRLTSCRKKTRKVPRIKQIHLGPAAANMDDEFALFAAEIGEIEKVKPPVTEEHEPEPPPFKPSKPAVIVAASVPRAATIAKAPEHVPVGPAARPPPPPQVAAPAYPPGSAPPPPHHPMAHHLPPHVGGGVYPNHGVPTGGYPPAPHPGYPSGGGHLPPVPGGALVSIPVKRVGKPVYRAAGGDRWVDPSLADWPEGDHRIFCGDLGLECTDDVLARAFSQYPSFAMARVVKDKKSGKNRGYGFVSMMDKKDHADAIRAMNGKYIGNRPCKLKNAEWETRNDAKGDERKHAPKRKVFEKRKHLPTGVDEDDVHKKKSKGGGKGGDGWGGGGSKGKFNLW